MNTKELLETPNCMKSVLDINNTALHNAIDNFIKKGKLEAISELHSKINNFSDILNSEEKHLIDIINLSDEQIRKLSNYLVILMLNIKENK